MEPIIKKNKINTKRAHHEKPINSSFELGIGSGINYTSYSQSGILGSADLGVLFINNFNFFTSYEIGKFRMEGESNSYHFEYSVNNSSSKMQLTNYSFRLSYKYFLLGLLMEQRPVFKNDSNIIETISETFTIPSIGVIWNTSFNTKVETHLLLQISVDYLPQSSSDDANIDISKNEGFGTSIKSRISRRLNHNSSFPIFYFWSNELLYRDFYRTIDWELSVGKVSTQTINFNSIIGLKAQF